MVARGFGGNLGTGNADRVITGLTVTPALASWFIWHQKFADAGTNPRLFSQGADKVVFFSTGAGSTYQFNYSWTGGAGNWTIARPVIGSLNLTLITYDSTSSANDPVIYNNGASVAVTRTAAPGGSPNPSGAYIIGNNNSHNRAWQGRLAWFVVWNQILNAREAAALGGGVIPFRVRPAAIVSCVPLFGRETSEPEFILANGPATVAGALSTRGPTISPMYLTHQMGN